MLTLVTVLLIFKKSVFRLMIHDWNTLVIGFLYIESISSYESAISFAIFDMRLALFWVDIVAVIAFQDWQDIDYEVDEEDDPNHRNYKSTMGSFSLIFSYSRRIRFDVVDVQTKNDDKETDIRYR